MVALKYLFMCIIAHNFLKTPAIRGNLLRFVENSLKLNDDDIVKCVRDICKHYFPIKANIFVLLTVGHSKSKKLESYLRRKRSLYNESITCSAENKLAGYRNISNEKMKYRLFNFKDYIISRCNFNVNNRNNLLSNSQNRVLKYIHPLTYWTFTVGKHSCNFDYKKFDGLIIMVHDDELYLDTKIRPSDLSYNAKVLVIVFGVDPDVKNIFKFLVDFYFTRSIVIHQDESKNWKILTWSHDECGNLKQIHLLGNCNESKYTPEEFEMPGISKCYKKCQYQLYGFNNPPFSISNSLGEVNGGIELKLLSVIASQLNIELKHFDYESYKLRTTFFFGATVVTDGSITLQYMARYYTERHTWFVPRAEFHPHWSSLTRVFKKETWVCVLLCLVSMSISLKYLGYIKNTSNLKCFLNLWAVFLNISVRERPHGIRLRAVFFTWVLLSIAVTTVFQAFMTSFFTDPGIQHQINTIKELDESDMSLSFSYSVYQYMNILEDSMKPNFLWFENNCEMLELCFSNSSIAALTTEEIFLYYSRLYSKNKPRSLFHKFTDEGATIHRSLGMSMRSPHLHLVNQITNRLMEAGIVDKIVDDFLDPSGWTRGTRMGKSSMRDYLSLSMFHMISPFMYLIFGYILSSLAFIAEVTVFKYYHKSE